MPAVSDGRLFVGLISGTSRDGVDAVLARLGNAPQIVDSQTLPYPEAIATQLRLLIDSGTRPTARQTALLHTQLGEVFADAVRRLLHQAAISPDRVTAVGSHGQTVWHEPNGPNSVTIQIGDPQLIADLTGIKTVADFRTADLEAGGQGAPLAPLLHRQLLQPAEGCVAVVNLGGIANVTLLHADGTVRGWDTGPANCLLDGWIRRHRDLPYDEGGQWSASGKADHDLLQRLMADAYFSQPSPKSTGVETFNMRWLKQSAEGLTDAMAPIDVQATLAELTVRSVAQALKKSDANELLVCGGGAHNADLINRLRAALPTMTVDSTQIRGLPPDSVEGLLMAWLAEQRLAGRPQDTRSITGALAPVLLGEIFEPQH